MGCASHSADQLCSVIFPSPATVNHRPIQVTTRQSKNEMKIQDYAILTREKNDSVDAHIHHYSNEAMRHSLSVQLY